MLKVDIVKKLWHFDLNVKFEIGNQIMVLWGPSGAGKTTILQCLAGLVTPSGGRIMLNNRILYSSIDKVNVPARYRDVGYLFQDYALFPHLTIKENVIYGVKCKKNFKTKQSVNYLEMLESFGVGHLLERYPHQLSGGEKQRVALARALAVQPKLLLLDEPLSAVDNDTRISLRREIKHLQKLWKIPFIVVTHDKEEADFLGDKILIVKNGLVDETIDMYINSTERKRTAAGNC